MTLIAIAGNSDAFAADGGPWCARPSVYVWLNQIEGLAVRAKLR